MSDIDDARKQHREAVEALHKAQADLDALLANGPEPRIWLEYRRERDAARALADELGRMLSEACWAIDHTCTQCGEREPAHTPRCPTYAALAKWEASRGK